MATSFDFGNEEEQGNTTKFTNLRSLLARPTALIALTCLSGCISVRRDVEPTTTTTVTRPVVVVPAATTTVERTTY